MHERVALKTFLNFIKCFYYEFFENMLNAMTHSLLPLIRGGEGI